MNPHFQDTDFHCILLAALRYSLTRHSYMPGLVADYITRNWASIPTNTQNLIIRDLQEFTQEFTHWQHDTLHAIDYTTWQNLLTTLTEHRKEQK